MRVGHVICDQCRKRLVQPAMIGVKMKYRANIGVYSVNKADGIMGFVEVDIEGDFCDAECLGKFVLAEAAKQDISVLSCHQDIYFRDESYIGLPKSEW